FEFGYLTIGIQPFYRMDYQYRTQRQRDDSALFRRKNQRHYHRTGAFTYPGSFGFPQPYLRPDSLGKRVSAPDRGIFLAGNKHSNDFPRRRATRSFSG